jgi:hypothetical protein
MGERATAIRKQSGLAEKIILPGERDRLDCVTQIRVRAACQRDEFSLCTSKFESDMPSHAVRSPPCRFLSRENAPLIASPADDHSARGENRPSSHFPVPLPVAPTACGNGKHESENLLIGATQVVSNYGLDWFTWHGSGPPCMLRSSDKSSAKWRPARDCFLPGYQSSNPTSQAYLKRPAVRPERAAGAGPSAGRQAVVVDRPAHGQMSSCRVRPQPYW